MIRIDGSIGEGGGHAVRMALTLAALTRRDVEVFNIGKGHRAPGLRHDLVALARGVAEVSRGRLEGDANGSDTLRFYPGIVEPGRFTLSAGESHDGRGSAPLLLQALLPVLALAGGASELVLSGATHGPNAPTATYIQTVFVPTARKFGLRGEVATPRWGWAPDGVGEIRARIEPIRAFRAAELTQRGELLQIGGTSVATGLDEGYAERQRNRVARRLVEFGRHADVQLVNVPSSSAGGMLFLLAVFERTIAGFTGVAHDGSAAEQNADVAVNELFAYLTSYSVLDRHLADQALVYAALAAGTTSFSTAELTERTVATAPVIEAFVPARISFAGAVGAPSEVEVIGAGFAR